MSRTPAPPMTVPDVLEVYRQVACPEGEFYVGFLNTKLGFAKAVCERDFGRLLDCLVEYSTDLIVLRQLTGLSLNLARPNVAFTKLRKWCGLSDAYERMFKAEREYYAKEDKLQSSDNPGFKESLVAQIHEIVEEGWTDIVAVNGFEYAYKPGDRTMVYTISGPSVPKASFWGIAAPLFKAKCAWVLAKREFEAETVKRNRAAYFVEQRATHQLTTGGLYFL
jgi:hypothetical protein